MMSEHIKTELDVHSQASQAYKTVDESQQYSMMSDHSTSTSFGSALREASEALYSGDNIELSSTSNIQRSYSTLKELKTTLEGMSSSDVDFLPEDMEGFEHNDNPPSEEDSQTPHLISKQKRKIACPFCGQEVMNFTRHLLRQHEKEEFVKEIKELTPNHNRIKYLKRLDSAEALAELNQTKQQISRRKFLIRKIQGLKRKGGKQIIAKRCNRPDPMLLPCPSCFNYYLRYNLQRHYSNCGDITEDKTNKSLLGAAEMMTIADEQPNFERDRMFYEKVVLGMKNMRAKQIIKSDPLLLSYGCRLLHKYQAPHLINMIRARLTVVAMVLEHIKTVDTTVNELEDIFNPSKWVVFTAALRNMPGVNKEGEMRAPSTLTSGGAEFLKVANFLLSKNLIAEKNVDIVDRWIRTYNTCFNEELAYQARKLREKRSWEKPKWLPMSNDITKFFEYCRSTIQQCSGTLNKGFDLASFNLLNKAVMMKLLIFNRKRIGEVDKFLLMDFERIEQVEEDSDVWGTLDTTEKVLARRFFHVKIRGKLNRGVPVLLDADDVNAISLIIRYRTDGGVGPSNPHLFGRFDEGTFNGPSTVIEFAKNSGLENPKVISSTRLRKHIATTSQVLSLTENDVSVLADFLGHDPTTHKKFYRLPDKALHTARLSRYLIALAEGNVGKLQGHNLLNIPVDVDVDEPSFTLLDSSQTQPPSSSALLSGPSTSSAAPSEPSTSLSPPLPSTSSAAVSAPSISFSPPRPSSLPPSPSSSHDEGDGDGLQLDSNSSPIARTSRGTKRSLTPSPDPGVESERLDAPDNITPKKLPTVGRQPWRTPETKAIKSCLSPEVLKRKGKLPSLNECRKMQQRFSCLKNRTPAQIKSYINNQQLRSSRKNQRKRD
uniref:Uncharacterized protein n=2 Tax=Lygus hesperus TaxID=30085 RepID=A0A0A9X9S8_LYGHE